MLTDATDQTPSAKIIPLRPDYHPPIAPPGDLASERGRRFLKITLPAIPVAVLTVTFLLVYAISARDAMLARRAINPLPAVICTLALTALTAGLCGIIYAGFRQVTGLSDASGDQ
jgi:hypothetical protein